MPVKNRSCFIADREEISDEIVTFDQEFMKTCNEHICRSVPKAEAVDQANAILYFASDLSKAVTGQALVVDYGCNL